jgi:hypothetical protein
MKTPRYFAPHRSNIDPAQIGRRGRRYPSRQET